MISLDNVQVGNDAQHVTRYLPIALLKASVVQALVPALVFPVTLRGVSLAVTRDHGAHVMAVKHTTKQPIHVGHGTRCMLVSHAPPRVWVTRWDVNVAHLPSAAASLVMTASIS